MLHQHFGVLPSYVHPVAPIVVPWRVFLNVASNSFYCFVVFLNGWKYCLECTFKAVYVLGNMDPGTPLVVHLTRHRLGPHRVHVAPIRVVLQRPRHAPVGQHIIQCTKLHYNPIFIIIYGTTEHAMFRWYAHHHTVRNPLKTEKSTHCAESITCCAPLPTNDSKTSKGAQ